METETQRGDIAWQTTLELNKLLKRLCDRSTPATLQESKEDSLKYVKLLLEFLQNDGSPFFKDIVETEFSAEEISQKIKDYSEAIEQAELGQFSLIKKVILDEVNYIAIKISESKRDPNDLAMRVFTEKNRVLSDLVAIF